ncbi:MAG: hypothetical protein IT176_12375 [Acidobacteria bacterium]|nr:hypothetical protein [Acidobacteriota bacterium]
MALSFGRDPRDVAQAGQLVHVSHLMAMERRLEPSPGAIAQPLQRPAALERRPQGLRGAGRDFDAPGELAPTEVAIVPLPGDPTLVPRETPGRRPIALHVEQPVAVPREPALDFVDTCRRRPRLALGVGERAARVVLALLLLLERGGGTEPERHVQSASRAASASPSPQGVSAG